jgi:hypothetical protein
VTLTITLVTPWAIHQSADFRLSRLDRDGTDQWIEVSNNSAKIIILQYFDWGAFISYSGMGMWNYKHTYQWLAEWLTHEPGEQRTFEDVLDVIQSRGSAWLHEIELARGEPRPHTFIVAGYVGGVAKVALISTHENLNTKERIAPTSSLLVSTSDTPRTQPIITGYPVPFRKRTRCFYGA